MDDNERTARILRAVADALLVPVAKVTGLPPETVQTFVEGSSVGAVKAGRARGRKRKVSAYSREFGRAYRRHADKMKKKNGDWRAGCSHGKCMKMAHKEVKRIMKKRK